MNKTFILSSDGKEVREKATMEKPKYVHGSMQYDSDSEDYEQHLASLAHYPASGFPSELWGKEIVEGVDFTLTYKEKEVSKGVWEVDPKVMVAIPLPAYNGEENLEEGAAYLQPQEANVEGNVVETFKKRIAELESENRMLHRDSNTLADMVSEAYDKMECTKPHCDCIFIAEKKAGGPVKNYPCLARINKEVFGAKKAAVTKAIKKLVKEKSEATGEEKKYSQSDIDLIANGMAEGAEMWKAEYDNCREILQLLVDLKHEKDENGKTEWYETNQPLAWQKAKQFLEKYQHQ